MQPTRLLRPRDFPGKSIGVGCHCLLQRNDWVFINNNKNSMKNMNKMKIAQPGRAKRKEGQVADHLMYFETLSEVNSAAREGLSAEERLWKNVCKTSLWRVFHKMFLWKNAQKVCLRKKWTNSLISSFLWWEVIKPITWFQNDWRE